MRPTLFADDVALMASNKLYALRRALTSLARILPTRCVCFEAHSYRESPSLCISCPNGLGFEYPPMPEWWGGPFDGQHAWEGSCEDMWRAMGILEGDD